MAPKVAPGASERAHDYKAHFLRARKRYDEVTAGQRRTEVQGASDRAVAKHRKLQGEIDYLLDAIAELSEARKRGVHLDFGRRSASANGGRGVTESHTSLTRESQAFDASRESTQDTPRDTRETHHARRSLYYSSEESDAEQNDEHVPKLSRKDGHPETPSSETGLENAQVKMEQDVSNHSAPSPPSPSGSQKRPRPAAQASELGDASIEDDLLDASSSSSPKRQRTE